MDAPWHPGVYLPRMGGGEEGGSSGTPPGSSHGGGGAPCVHPPSPAAAAAAERPRALGLSTRDLEPQSRTHARAPTAPRRVPGHGRNPPPGRGGESHPGAAAAPLLPSGGPRGGRGSRGCRTEAPCRPSSRCSSPAAVPLLASPLSSPSLARLREKGLSSHLISFERGRHRHLLPSPPAPR